MKLYKLSQSINNRYDTYDSAIVCADSKEDARAIHPSDYVTHYRDWKWYGIYSENARDISLRWKEYVNDTCYSWVSGESIDSIEVEEIWEANENQKRWVILSSFNAG